MAGYVSGRSGSMDRSGHLHLHDTSGEYSSLVHHGLVQPLQPIMQDSSMPLLNPPNPTTQLEEAKRLLEDAETKHRLSKSKYVPLFPTAIIYLIIQNAWALANGKGVFVTKFFFTWKVFRRKIVLFEGEKEHSYDGDGTTEQLSAVTTTITTCIEIHSIRCCRSSWHFFVRGIFKIWVRSFHIFSPT